LLGGSLEFFEDAIQAIRKLQILNQARRKIHCNREIQAALSPVAHLPDRIGHHKVSDTYDEAGLFGECQEFARIQQT
jgi:hypothetical protein